MTVKNKKNYDKINLRTCESCNIQFIDKSQEQDRYLCNLCEKWEKCNKRSEEDGWNRQIDDDIRRGL